MPRVSEDILAFVPPSPEFIERGVRPLARWFDPQFYGLENVDKDSPSLFVGNHTIFGVIDSPLMFSGLYSRTGVYLRSLGDHWHFTVPGWGDRMREFGTVPGTPENCRTLMEAGQHILVFPGGAREVAKRKGEENRLTWKNRTGFARMAIEHGYPIMPFAALGADDSYTILFDADDFKESWLGRRLLRNERMARLLRDGDVFMPLVRGLGPTSLPRPERFYFKFGKPISTLPFAGKADSKAAQWELREQVADAIERMMEELKEIRANDKLPLWRRVLTRRKAD
jgi:1-acyl-sn-glycerol-3-phosphate acyltransferase